MRKNTFTSCDSAFEDGKSTDTSMNYAGFATLSMGGLQLRDLEASFLWARVRESTNQNNKLFSHNSIQVLDGRILISLQNLVFDRHRKVPLLVLWPLLVSVCFEEDSGINKHENHGQNTECHTDGKTFDVSRRVFSQEDVCGDDASYVSESNHKCGTRTFPKVSTVIEGSPADKDRHRQIETGCGEETTGISSIDVVFAPQDYSQADEGNYQVAKRVWKPQLSVVQGKRNDIQIDECANPRVDRSLVGCFASIAHQLDDGCGKVSVTIRRDDKPEIAESCHPDDRVFEHGHYVLQQMVNLIARVSIVNLELLFEEIFLFSIKETACFWEVWNDEEENKSQTSRESPFNDENPLP